MYVFCFLFVIFTFIHLYPFLIENQLFEKETNLKFCKLAYFAILAVNSVGTVSFIIIIIIIIIILIVILPVLHNCPDMH